MDNIKLKMKYYTFNVIGISEMIWPEPGDFCSEEYRIIHFGSSENDTAVVGVNRTTRQVICTSK